MQTILIVYLTFAVLLWVWHVANETVIDMPWCKDSLSFREDPLSDTCRLFVQHQ